MYVGRSEIIKEFVEQLIVKVIERSIPLVIDADGLWVVSQNIGIVKGYKK